MTKSEFEKDVLDKDELLQYVIRVHLHIERWLQELIRHALPKPEVMFDLGGSPKFSQLVTLSEALGVIPSDLAKVIRKVNDLRNEYAHVRHYKPSKSVILDIQKALRELDEPFFMSYVPPTPHELGIALASLAGYLERKTIDCRKASKETLKRKAYSHH